MQLTPEQQKQIAVANLQKCGLILNPIDTLEIPGHSWPSAIAAGSLIIEIPNFDNENHASFYRNSLQIITGIEVKQQKWQPITHSTYGSGIATVGLIIQDPAIIQKLAEAGLQFPGSELFAPKSHAQAIKKS